MVAAVTAAGLLAPGGAAPVAHASCTTVIIADEKTCPESIPCELRDGAAASDPRVAALVAKYGSYDCIQ